MPSTFKLTLVFSVLLLTAVNPIIGQESELLTLEQLQETVEGKVVLQFVNHINADGGPSEKSVEELWQSNVIETLGMDVMERMDKVYKRRGRITVFDVTRTDEYSFQLKSKLANVDEWYDLKIVVSKEESGKICEAVLNKADVQDAVNDEPTITPEMANGEEDQEGCEKCGLVRLFLVP